jgi:polysaccharide export outer membrane protein
MKKYWSICWLGLVLLGLAGCQHPGPRFNPYDLNAGRTLDLQTVSLTNKLNPEWLKPPTAPFTLGPGDRVEVELMDDITSRTVAVVGPDGKIYFNLLPGIDVWGLTMPQAKELLEKELSQFYRQQPRVSLTLRGVESRRVWLLGRIQTPGVYFMTNSPTLLEAITLAGGTLSLAGTRDLSVSTSLDDTADLRRSFLIRKGQLLPINFERLINQGDLSQNIFLEPDDFIYFPPATAREVYVMGAVGQPRAVPYMEGMTMAGAIADAFGTVKDAYLSHVAVVRGSLTEPKVALVDFGDVVRGKARDVVLQPNDIVYVPYAPYRFLTRYADMIVNTFVSSVALNEGIRAVGPRPAGAAGVFIPLGSQITVKPAPGFNFNPSSFNQ